MLKALAKNPTGRYPGVISFARALERASLGTPSQSLVSATAGTAAADGPPGPLTQRVFLSCAPGEDLERLKADLTIRDVEVMESGSAREEEQLRQAVRAAQAVLLVASPRTRSAAAVKEHLGMADLYRRPVLCLWVEGQKKEDVLPPAGVEMTVIDARAERYASALNEVLHVLGRYRWNSSQAVPLLAEPVVESRNPYKGLRTFTSHDRADFFGRETLVLEMEELVQHLPGPTLPGVPAQRLLAVVGPSGSGKSSVVMAGLLPQLQDGDLPHSETWRYLDPFVPGKHPLDALAQTLASHLPDRSVERVREVLGREGGFGLHQLALSLIDQQGYLVLLVDQCEELFSQEVTEQERKQFIEVLVTAAAEPRGPVVVLLTLRADFYDRPLAYPELGQLIQQQQCTVLSMEMQEVRAAIERPALAPDVKLTLTNSTISGNTANQGLFNVGALTLTNSTVAGNTADDGGGIDNTYSGYSTGNSYSGTDGGGRLTLTNSTIAGNRAKRGGGIFIQSLFHADRVVSLLSGARHIMVNNIAQVDLSFSTIYGNTASEGGDIAVLEDMTGSDGNIVPITRQSSQVRIRDSIVAGDFAHPGPDMEGMLTSYGYNLMQDHSGATFDPATRTQHSTDKLLSAQDLSTVFADRVRLQNNGGPTQTLALAPNSPARDQIPPAACHAITIPIWNAQDTPTASSTLTITTDQRGMKRADGGKNACDIGAYEYIGSST